MKKNKRSVFMDITYLLRFAQLCLVIGIMGGTTVINYNIFLGLATIMLCIIILGFSFRVQGNLKRKLEQEVYERVNSVGKLRKNLFTASPIPVAIVLKNGDIEWHNESFTNIVGEETLINKNINNIFKELNLQNLNALNKLYEKAVQLNSKEYVLFIEPMNVDENTVNEVNYIVYLIDYTERNTLKREITQQRCMVGYLCIDNYEEIMQSTEEIRRPVLSAVIDRKLNLWFKDKEVVYTKFERDKYILFFTTQALNKMESAKFDVLDELRHVQVGNELPVSISIGIGQNRTSLNQSKEDARAAFDLALGRGGDQAIIKNHDRYTFYGGKTKEVEKSARVKVRVKAYAFKELLAEADKVYVMGHKNIDMDCLGAAMGVYRAATLMGKKAQIILDEPTFAIQGLYDRIMASNEYKHLFITPEQAENEINKESLLVIVDVHRRSYLAHPLLLDECEKVVVFDHHIRSTDCIDDAVLTYIEPFISSTCEMISEILNYLTDKVKLTQIEADALLAGITIDTKNFVFKAGVRTFEAAAFLRRNGADSTRVRLLFQNDMNMYKVRAASIKDAEIWEEDIAVSVVNGKVMYANVIAAQVADELLNIKGIQSAFVITDMDGTLLISARAMGDMNVQRIMEYLGGGGHKSIAGAQLKDVTVEEAKERLREAIKEYYEEEGER